MPIRITRYEVTPNPNALKAVLDRSTGAPLPEPTATRSFRSAQEAQSDPWASKCFEVPGLAALLFGAGWLTINKETGADWKALKAGIERVLADVP